MAELEYHACKKIVKSRLHIFVSPKRTMQQKGPQRTRCRPWTISGDGAERVNYSSLSVEKVRTEL